MATGIALLFASDIHKTLCVTSSWRSIRIISESDSQRETVLSNTKKGQKPPLGFMFTKKTSGEWEVPFLQTEEEGCLLDLNFSSLIQLLIFFVCPGLSNIIHLHYVGFRHQANGSLHFSYPPAISIVFLAKNINHITTFK